jgi:hypothetical protein
MKKILNRLSVGGTTGEDSYVKNEKFVSIQIKWALSEKKMAK